MSIGAITSVSIHNSSQSLLTLLEAKLKDYVSPYSDSSKFYSISINSFPKDLFNEYIKNYVDAGYKEELILKTEWVFGLDGKIIVARNSNRHPHFPVSELAKFYRKYLVRTNRSDCTEYLGYALFSPDGDMWDTRAYDFEGKYNEYCKEMIPSGFSPIYITDNQDIVRNKNESNAKSFSSKEIVVRQIPVKYADQINPRLIEGKLHGQN
jgi:hypothetical protein